MTGSTSPSLADVAGIIGATGLEVEVNLAVLQNDLDWSETHYQTRLAIAASHALRPEIESVEAAAKKLHRLLTNEVRMALGIPDRRDAIQSIVDAAAAKLRSTTGASASIESALREDLGFDRRSAFEWLVGEQLPAVFKKHLKVEAGYTRDHADADNAVGGPYIRFAIMTMSVLGITNKGKPYSADSIAKALSTAKSGRPRKKS